MDLILSILKKQQQSRIRQQYFAELRSGKHKQQTHVTQMQIADGRVCALGVAAVMLGLPCRPEHGDMAFRLRDPYDEVAAALGAKDLLMITKQNDLDKHTFSQIADELERNESKYFNV